MRRKLPWSQEAEMSVLGAVLLRNEALRQLERLEPGEFFDPKNKLVFTAMRALDEKHRPVDVTTLEAELQRMGNLDAIGGIAYLSELAMRVPTADNVEHYAAIVSEKRAVRELIATAGELIERAYGDYGQLDEFFDWAEAKSFAVTQREQRSGPRSVKVLIKDVFRSLDERYGKGGLVGIPFGFYQADEITGGAQPGEMHVLAARPAHGKSAMVLSIAEHAGSRGWPSLIFSLEMSAQQNTERLLSAVSEVDSNRLRRGQLFKAQEVNGVVVEGDLTKLTTGANALANLPIYIDDTPALTLREVRARARRWKATPGLFTEERPYGLIGVDYLQLMRGLREAQNREQEVAHISRGLKALAKELGCPVLALSQLNRKVDDRQDHTPTLADLRESGAIEQDADVIWFLMRPGLYPEHADKPLWLSFLFCGKNRHGPVGRFELRYDGQYTRFTNPSSREPS